MKTALLALAFALAGCGVLPPIGPISPDRPPEGTCSTERLPRLVGRAGTPELGAEAQRRSGAARLRWIRPGDMVTMDFSPQRLNIYLDAQDVVERLACG
jgi:hypothetical protein